MSQGAINLLITVTLKGILLSPLPLRQDDRPDESSCAGQPIGDFADDAAFHIGVCAGLYPALTILDTLDGGIFKARAISRIPCPDSRNAITASRRFFSVAGLPKRTPSARVANVRKVIQDVRKWQEMALLLEASGL
jgi:hypothetical protein